MTIKIVWHRDETTALIPHQSLGFGGLNTGSRCSVSCLPEVHISASRSAGGSEASLWRGSDTAILPQVSVMPYDTKKRQPKAATALAIFAGGSGEPPQDSRRRLDRPARRSAGLLSISVTMVDARFVTDTRSRSACPLCNYTVERLDWNMKV